MCIFPFDIWIVARGASRKGKEQIQPRQESINSDARRQADFLTLS
jgi:hypothetical protein